MINKKQLTHALYLSGITLLSLNTPVQADSNRLQWESNKHFYQRFDQPLTWLAAQARCQLTDGHLVTITSDPERDFINNNMYKNSAFWIGASDVAVNGRFNWVTGEKWGYQNFATGFRNIKNADYLWATTYEWGANAKDGINSYVCEWSNHNYVDIASVPDFNGNGAKEIAVMYVDYITQKHVVKIRDSKTSAVLSTLTFKSGLRAPLGLVVIDDINGNRVPEIGALYSQIGALYSEFGQPSINIKDAKNDKVYLKSLSFLNSSFAPKEVMVSPDTNGNRASEITVLGIGKADNMPRAETRDSKSGAVLSSMRF